jgi:tetratricopeptide (TPR) repeat protein
MSAPSRLGRRQCAFAGCLPIRISRLSLFDGSHDGSARRAPTDLTHYRDLALAAEAAKLDSVFFADHVALGEHLGHAARGELDPLTLLGALAAPIHVAVSAIFVTDDWVAQLAALAAAEVLSDRALSLAPNHAVAHMTLGGVYMVTNRAAQGVAECERALALDHNLAYAHGGIGLGKLYLGRAAETEGHVLKALRLSPRDLSAYQWTLFVGIAKIHLGTGAEAVDWLRRSIEANRHFPPGHFTLAAVLALLGALDEARTAAKAGLALNPSFTLRRYRLNAPSDNPTFLAGRERIYQGLHLAGVPEG